MTSSKLLNKPKQYKQGWVEFYKLRFKVTPDVLIPRPETELLVDAVLALFRSHLNKGRTSTIVDVGTGCGNIAISIAKNLPSHIPGSPREAGGNVKIIATDISQKALKVAQQNTKLHGVSDQITLMHGDLLDCYDRLVYHNKIHPNVIITNLPYIPSERIPYLDSSVKDFEPLVALDGGFDGFDLYRKLFAQIKKRGWAPKLIVGEIDYTQGELAADEASKYFPDHKIEINYDLARKQRTLRITD